MNIDRDPTNADRAEWARQTLSRFGELTGADTLDTQVVDLLANLLHLLDRDAVSVEWEADPVERLAGYLDLAVYHYRAELKESGTSFAATFEAAVDQAETLAQLEQTMFVVFDNLDGGTAPTLERFVVVRGHELYPYRGTVVHVADPSYPIYNTAVAL